jgi:hypothetical protein
MILWLSQLYTLIDLDVASAAFARDTSTDRRIGDLAGLQTVVNEVRRTP